MLLDDSLIDVIEKIEKGNGGRKSLNLWAASHSARQGRGRMVGPCDMLCSWFNPHTGW